MPFLSEEFLTQLNGLKDQARSERGRLMILGRALTEEEQWAVKQLESLEELLRQAEEVARPLAGAEQPK